MEIENITSKEFYEEIDLLKADLRREIIDASKAVMFTIYMIVFVALVLIASDIYNKDWIVYILPASPIVLFIYNLIMMYRLAKKLDKEKEEKSKV